MSARDTGGASSAADRPDLTIVVPTIGRRSLRTTLESIADQDVGPRTVEVIVVGDGPRPQARTIFEAIAGGRATWRYLEHGPSRDQGNSQRTAGMASASGRHLMFIDDDDVYLPGAVRRVIDAVAQAPDRPHLFRFDRFGVLYWREQVLQHGNVGAPCIVTPNLPGRLGSWAIGTRLYGTDYQFIEQSVAALGEPVWQDDVIVVCDQPYWLPWRRRHSNRLTRRFDRVRTSTRVRTRLRRLLNRDPKRPVWDGKP